MRAIVIVRDRIGCSTAQTMVRERLARMKRGKGLLPLPVAKTKAEGGSDVRELCRHPLYFTHATSANFQAPARAIHSGRRADECSRVIGGRVA